MMPNFRTCLKMWWRFRTRLGNVIAIILTTFIISLLVCDWLIFEIAFSFCAFPALYNRTTGSKSDDVLHVMLLGDLHMYGSYKGHWADRIKRESQMRTAFRAAVRQMRPDVIFFLGDSLDEGKWADTAMFEKVTRRFNRYFRDYVLSLNEGIEMYVITGNHDIGFHYDMNHLKIMRFEENFNSTLVKLVVKNGIPFILLNSVTMKNDSCHICQDTMRRLKVAKQLLGCLANPIGHKCQQLLASNNIKLAVNQKINPNPIMLQHFPLFRETEAKCSEADWTSMNLNLSAVLKQDWDVLSEKVSQNLFSILKPRLAFSAHSHYYCRYLHNFTTSKGLNEQKSALEEVTINSFSWKNNDNSHFLLLSVNTDHFDYTICSLPRETFQVFLYVVIWCYAFVCIRKGLKNPSAKLFFDFGSLGRKLKRTLFGSLKFNIKAMLK